MNRSTHEPTVARVLCVGIAITVLCGLSTCHAAVSSQSSCRWIGNTGDVGSELYNVRFRQSGSTIRMSYNYKVWDNENRTALVQILVGLDRNVVGVVYSGMPGSGRRGRGSVSFRIPRGRREILIAGLWTTSVSKARYEFENENGGHVCWLGRVSGR